LRSFRLDFGLPREDAASESRAPLHHAALAPHAALGAAPVSARRGRCLESD
jgi:hypothetical protein